MSKSKVKAKKADKKKKLIIAIAIIAVIVIVATAVIILATRKKENGIYSWLGTKMKADEILTLTVDIGEGEQVYEVPFSTFRGIYLYYASRVSDYVVYKDENAYKDAVGDGGNVIVAKGEDGSIAVFTTVAEKSKVVKEFTEDALVSYYSNIALADKLGVGLTSDDLDAYNKTRDKKIAEYAENIPEDAKFKGTKEEYAHSLYDGALKKLGMTEDYFEYSYYNSLLISRIKSALAYDIESTINDSYFAYKSIYVTFTKGDTASERAAYAKISDALEKLNSGADADALIEEYNGGVNAETTYFDINYSIVSSGSSDTVGPATAEMTMALDFGENSGIISGDEEDENYGYYAILIREKITKDFVCGDNPTAQRIYQYPYYGASSYSQQYAEYRLYMDMYEQNMSVVPVSERVYDRIAVNTLY
ncbi:MAG: hypothetical protein KBS59_07845 [Clostridiales bacterium]|nr:hypothetical protein [Clostridiales bacterium]